MENCHCISEHIQDLDSILGVGVHPKFRTNTICSQKEFQLTFNRLRGLSDTGRLDPELVWKCFRVIGQFGRRVKRKVKPHKKPSKKPKTKVRKPEEHTISKSRKFFDDAFLYEVKEKQLRARKYLAMDMIKDTPEEGYEELVENNPTTLLMDTTTQNDIMEKTTDKDLMTVESEVVSSKDDKVNNRSRRSNPINSGDSWETFTRPQGITWRLTDPYTDPTGILTSAKQRDEITLALGTWERSSNLCFREDTTSQSVNFVFRFRPGL